MFFFYSTSLDVALRATLRLAPAERPKWGLRPHASVRCGPHYCPIVLGALSVEIHTVKTLLPFQWKRIAEYHFLLSDIIVFIHTIYYLSTCYAHMFCPVNPVVDIKCEGVCYAIELSALDESREKGVMSE